MKFWKNPRQEQIYRVTFSVGLSRNYQYLIRAKGAKEARQKVGIPKNPMHNLHIYKATPSDLKKLKFHG